MATLSVVELFLSEEMLLWGLDDLVSGVVSLVGCLPFIVERLVPDTDSIMSGVGQSHFD